MHWHDGVQRMVDDDAYCVDVLTQISAATKALQAVAPELLDQHLSHCVADAIGEGGSAPTGASSRYEQSHGLGAAPGK